LIVIPVMSHINKKGAVSLLYLPRAPWWRARACESQSRCRRRAGKKRPFNRTPDLPLAVEAM